MISHWVKAACLAGMLSLAAFVSPTASAVPSLIGDTVNWEDVGYSSVSGVVAAGNSDILTTFYSGLPLFSADEEALSVRITLYSSYANVGAGFVAALTDLDFGSDGCYLSGVTLNAGGITDLIASDDPVVPEPATLGLIGMGLAGFAAARKRRRA